MRFQIPIGAPVIDRFGSQPVVESSDSLPTTTMAPILGCPRQDRRLQSGPQTVRSPRSAKRDVQREVEQEDQQEVSPAAAGRCPANTERPCSSCPECSHGHGARWESHLTAGPVMIGSLECTPAANQDSCRSPNDSKAGATGADVDGVAVGKREVDQVSRRETCECVRAGSAFLCRREWSVIRCSRGAVPACERGRAQTTGSWLRGSTVSRR